MINGLPVGEMLTGSFFIDHSGLSPQVFIYSLNFRFIREIMRRLSLLKDYVVLFQIELSYQKKELFLNVQKQFHFFSEPLVGFEPTTPRLQITCSGQLS